MANYTQIDKLIEIADNRSVRTILMSSVSAITLAGCMGGGGGGTFGVFGSVSTPGDVGKIASQCIFQGLGGGPEGNICTAF